MLPEEFGLAQRVWAEGMVEINVRYHPVFSSQIEQQLIKSFGIKRALIALDHPDENEQRQQVASLVSTYLSTSLKNGMTVAVGQGRNVPGIGFRIAPLHQNGGCT